MATENKYQKSIDRLNQAIGKEIATTLQYLYFHVHFEDDGYEYFSKMMKQTSITEMFHTDKIADRILFLQGEVEMMPSFEPRKIRDVKEALEFSMTLEQRTVDSYNEWARLCAAEDDQITHKLFQDLAKEEEEHLDMFRTEMENMLNYGEQYLALQSIAHSKEITKGEFYQFNLSSCIRQQNSLTAQFVSFSLANLANIFYPPPIFTIINLCLL